MKPYLNHAPLLYTLGLSLWLGGAVFAHDLANGDPEGRTKWYWTLYNIPADVTHLDKNTKGIGRPGTGFKGQLGYEPRTRKAPAQRPACSRSTRSPPRRRSACPPRR